ncbi:MAG: HU family DNA-binding protein [Bacteroidaceae bacterium]|nr:HU family DNA-binding protein [Bacteroidaceae bacterium]
MDKRILQAELATLLAQRADIPIADAEQFTAQFFAVIGSGLLKENLVKTRGLGTFKIIDVSSRSSVNVNTGERYEIASHAKVSFTPEANLRDIINRPFASFETVLLNEGTDIARMEEGLTDDTRLSEDIEVAAAPEPTVTPEPETVSTDNIPTEEPAEGIQPEPIAEEAAPAVEEVTTEVTEEAEATVDAPAEVVAIAEAAPAEAEVTTNETMANDNEPAAPAAIVETSEPVAAETVTSESVAAEGEKKSGCMRTILLCLAACVIFIIGFCAGYFMRPQMEQPIPVKQELETPTKDTIAEAVQASSKQQAPPETLAYPQIEEGDYYIVGIRDTVVAKPGMTLLNIAIKYYRDKDLYIYICKMNGIDNPNHIQPDQQLIIPDLVKKEQD